MARFYSQSTGCTYLPQIHGKDMPPDVVEISEAVFLAVIANPAPGKIRSHDAAGLPVLIDSPQASTDQLAEQERRWRDDEIAAHEWLVSRHRAEVELQRETTLTAEQYAELLQYLQALRDWPAAEAFPDSAQRPVAPPWIAEQVQ